MGFRLQTDAADKGTATREDTTVYAQHYDGKPLVSAVAINCAPAGVGLGGGSAAVYPAYTKSPTKRLSLPLQFICIRSLLPRATAITKNIMHRSIKHTEQTGIGALALDK